MSCQDVAFAHASCRIEVSSGTRSPGLPAFTARMALLEDEGRTVRPLVFADGRHAEIHATSEPLAMRSSMGFLEQCFGALAEPEHECIEPPAGARTGDPYVVSDWLSARSCQPSFEPRPPSQSWER